MKPPEPPARGTEVPAPQPPGRSAPAAALPGPGLPDAEALVAELADRMRAAVAHDACFVGI